MFKKFRNMFNDDDKASKKPTRSKESPIGILPEYVEWRDVVFAIKAADVGVDAAGEERVYGTIMDVGLPKASGMPSNDNLVVSVTAFASMECSMRTSFGGGLIGVGEHPPINQQLQLILPLSAKLVSMAKVSDTPIIPTSGIVHFHFLTTNGLKLYDVPIQEVMNHSHPYAELFARFSQVKGIIDKLWDANQRKGSK